MEWIDKILPIVALILGWSLSEIGKYFGNKKEDKKKVKKLLFNLLELRYLLDKDIELEKSIEVLITKIKQKIPLEYQELSDLEIKIVKPLITQLLKDKIVNPKQIQRVESNIDSILTDLSEILPIFAYEFKGQFNIKERLQKFSNYFDEIKSEFSLPFAIKEHFSPKLTDELLENFNDNILKISKLINRKTYKQTKEKINIIKQVNIEEMDDYIDDYINEYLKILENETGNI